MFENQDVIPGFYLPICTGHLLLPNVSVAEVVSYREPEEGAAEGGSVLGKIRWRGSMVPLVVFEEANGQKFEHSATQRVAVLNTIGEHHQKMPFIAIVTQGIPRLVKITPKLIDHDNTAPGPCESARVVVDGEHASIPDLVALEKLAETCL